MTDSDHVIQRLNELKSCPSAEIYQYVSAVLDPFRFLPAGQKEEIAQSFYLWALDNADTQPLKYSYAELLRGLAYHLNDDHEHGLFHLSRARTLFEEREYAEGVGTCAILLGSIYRTLGNFDLALKMLWEGYALLKQSPHYWIFLSGCTNSIANINLEMHNYDEALSMFMLTYEESEKGGDEYFSIYALHGMGKVNDHKQRHDIAKGFFEKALRLAEKNGAPAGIATSLTELANFYVHPKQFKEAEQLNRQALDIRQENNLTGGAITNCILLGEIYISLGRWDEAMEILLKGLKMADQIKVKPKIYQIHRLLSEIYESKGELEKSLEHFKRFHEIRQQVEEEDNARKLADAKLIFEAEQAKKENIIIKNQKSEIEKKNRELEDTIYELTLAKISRKAKVFTWIFAIILFIFQDSILGFVLRVLSSSNYYVLLLTKMAIIFSLSPINSAIEHYLLKRVVKIKNPHQVAMGH